MTTEPEPSAHVVPSGDSFDVYDAESHHWIATFYRQGDAQEFADGWAGEADA